MAKLIGILSHLCYWLIFGSVNPVQIEKSILKQMLINMYELFLNITNMEKNNLNCKIGKKLENYLLSPMVILTLKLITAWILRNSYTFFFEE
jgi:hypothetical protein